MILFFSEDSGRNRCVFCFSAGASGRRHLLSPLTSLDGFLLEFDQKPFNLAPQACHQRQLPDER